MWWSLGLALAQETRALSLEEALALALASSEAITLAEAESAGASADRAAARGGYLPQVGADVSYSHTFVSEYDGLFDTGGATKGAANPFADLPFGAADTWRATLSASQVVYGGGRVRAQARLAEAGLDLASAGLVTAEATARNDVLRSYLDAAVAVRLREIAEAGVAQAETTLRHAQEGFRVGRQPEFEVLRAQVELENQRTQLVRQTRYESVATAALLQLLDLPAAPVFLTTALDGTLPEAFGEREGERLLVEQAEAGVRVAEAGVGLARSAGLPQVGVSASGGWVAYPENPLPPTEDWRPNVSAAASVHVPLFGGGVVRAQVNGAKADLVAAEARLEQARELAELDALDAAAALDAARVTFAAAAATVSQADRAYQIAEVRFREGLSTQSELTDARLLLQRAQATQAQAARDLSLALFRSQNLSALPPQIGG